MNRLIELEINQQDLARIKKRFEDMPKVLLEKLRNLVAYATLGIERESKIAVSTGETRAFNTGNLFRSITSSFDGLVGYVIPRAPYAIFVHEGTRYMRARPFMDVGVKRFIPTLNKYMKSMLTD